jgi:hypothetical protein
MRSLLTAIQQKDYGRTVPRNIIYDQEKLYEELLKAKDRINYLQMENHRQRTRA